MLWLRRWIWDILSNISVANFQRQFLALSSSIKEGSCCDKVQCCKWTVHHIVIDLYLYVVNDAWCLTWGRRNTSDHCLTSDLLPDDFISLLSGVTDWIWNWALLMSVTGDSKLIKQFGSSIWCETMHCLAQNHPQKFFSEILAFGGKKVIPQLNIVLKFVNFIFTKLGNWLSEFIGNYRSLNCYLA